MVAFSKNKYKVKNLRDLKINIKTSNIAVGCLYIQNIIWLHVNTTILNNKPFIWFIVLGLYKTPCVHIRAPSGAS